MGSDFVDVANMGFLGVGWGILLGRKGDTKRLSMGLGLTVGDGLSNDEWGVMGGRLRPKEREGEEGLGKRQPPL